MNKGWRIQKYGPLGWMEALIKIIAIGVAMGSLSVYSINEKKISNLRIGEAACMCILGALFVALVVHRILDQELFMLAFMIIQVVGHWMLTSMVFLAIGKYF